MSNVRKCIKDLERLSLLTCNSNVLELLERTLNNVKPILEVDTRDVVPLLWQNNLDINRLHSDTPVINLSPKNIKDNASNFHEDYIVIGNFKEKRAEQDMVKK